MIVIATITQLPTKKLIKYPENPNINSIRNKFASFKDFVLKETDICLSSETKKMTHFQSPSLSQKVIESFEKIETKMVAVL